MSQLGSVESRVPRLCLPGRVVGQRLAVEGGQLAVVCTYSDGLVVTFYVDEEGVRFEANRSWTTDEDGVVVFAGTGKPS